MSFYYIILISIKILNRLIYEYIKVRYEIADFYIIIILSSSMFSFLFFHVRLLR